MSDISYSRKLSYPRLTAISIGATIGAGVFSLSGDFAANGAHTGAVLVGWAFCGVGMLSMVLCFYGLSIVKPDLRGGMYSYAGEGFGSFMGFNSAWGYWISCLLADVSYSTFLFAAIGYFIKIFGDGNNLLSIICASGFIWFLAFLISRGIKSAAGVNLIVTISKVLPIFVFILFLVFLKAFDWEIFMHNFWGDGSRSFMSQVRATTITTVWAFTGMEGVVAVSERARSPRAVGKALITAYFSVLLIYIMVSTLSMGVMTREELAVLSNPPLAGVFEAVAGKTGSMIINLGVIISLTGASLGFLIVAAEVPNSAAKKGAFLKFFGEDNKHGAPQNSLIITTIIIQLFLVVTYVNSSTYQIFYTISASMVLIPYLLSALYYLKIVIKKDGFERQSKGALMRCGIVAFMGTLYSVWLVYAVGFVSLLITALLYAPGAIVYAVSRKQSNKGYFDNWRDKILLVLFIALAVVSFVLIANKTIKPF
jgi:arginine:ornithine antiporter/lysine permease